MRTSVDVHNYLIERNAPHEVFQAGGRFRSPERMAAVLDLPPAEVGRVIIFESEDGAVAAVVPVDRDPDVRLLRRAARRDVVERADDQRTAELTDYLPEAVPPAGLPNGIALILDRSLRTDEVLYFPGGEPKAVLKIRGTDLARATGAKVARITREP
ncbi:MAG TPA: YbaK/EbsC family protein [Actinomycetota bacterium]|nr:YbaK/EbsC family protein [Actinomycetota bacterium]